MKKLSRKQKKQIAAIAAKKDADIDLTDMPEALDWSKAEIGTFYRPMKKPVTIRLDTDIISWLKSYGRGYQTKANMLLRHAMKSSVRATANKRRSARGPFPQGKLPACPCRPLLVAATLRRRLLLSPPPGSLALF